MTKAKIEKIASQLDWNIEWYISGGNKWVVFSKSSPCGQDFSIELCYINLEQLIEELYNYYDNYDPSYQAYIWLDNSGHGKNGAPYEMGDVYNDMCDCKKMVEELYDALVA